MLVIVQHEVHERAPVSVDFFRLDAQVQLNECLERELSDLRALVIKIFNDNLRKIRDLLVRQKVFVRSRVSENALAALNSVLRAGIRKLGLQHLAYRNLLLLERLDLFFLFQFLQIDYQF